MNATKLLWAALAAAALWAVGCEPAMETRKDPTVKPPEPQPKPAAIETARLQEDNDSLRAKLKEAQTGLDGAQAQARQGDEDLRKQKAEAARAAGEAAASITQLRSEVKRLDGLLTGATAANKTLQEHLTKASETNAQLTARLTDADKAVADLTRKSQADQAAAKKAQDDVLRLGTVVEALRQEITKRDNQISALEMRLTGRTTAKAEPAPVWPKTATSEPPAPQENVKVSAKLTTVRADMGRIDAGTALGVQRGMRMAIYRGDKFIAFFQVSEADLKSAGGFILSRRADPQVGDTVISLPPEEPAKEVQ